MGKSGTDKLCVQLVLNPGVLQKAMQAVAGKATHSGPLRVTPQSGSLPRRPTILRPRCRHRDGRGAAQALGWRVGLRTVLGVLYFWLHRNGHGFP